MSTSVPPPGMPEPRPPAPAASASVPRSRSQGGMWKLLAGVGVLAALVIVALVAFGSSSSNQLDPIARAAALSSGTPGYQMRMTMQVTVPGLGQSINTSGSGVADLRDHAASMSMVMDVPGQAAQALGSSSLRIDFITEGTTIYMRMPAALMGALHLSGKSWAKIDAGKLAGLSGLSSLQGNPAASDPRRVLDFLRAASDAVSTEGRQVINGVQTTHYRASVSLAGLANVLPSAQRGAMEQLLSRIGSVNFPLDVWVDAHHLVRRLSMQMTFGPVQESMTIDLTHYGLQRRPTPPPAGQVQDITGLASGSSSF